METMLNLKDLLLHEVEDLYSAEEQIIEALPKMVEKATDRDLKKSLTDHLKVTRDQKDRLDKVKQLLGQETEEQQGFLNRIFGGGTKCKGTEGLIKEGEKMMGEDMDPKVMDAAIIASCQKIEHYEISGYGTARAFAAELGLTEVARLLEETLNEEYFADDSLTALALRKVNLNAENGVRRGQQRGSSSGNGQASGGGRSAAKKGGSAQKKSGAKKGASKKGASKKSSSGRTASKKAAGKKSATKKSGAKKARR